MIVVLFLVKVLLVLVDVVGVKSGTETASCFFLEDQRKPYTRMGESVMTCCHLF